MVPHCRISLSTTWTTWCSSFSGAWSTCDRDGIWGLWQDLTDELFCRPGILEKIVLFPTENHSPVHGPWTTNGGHRVTYVNWILIISWMLYEPPAHKDWCDSNPSSSRSGMCKTGLQKKGLYELPRASDLDSHGACSRCIAPSPFCHLMASWRLPCARGRGHVYTFGW